jgi:hypothetical protein
MCNLYWLQIFTLFQATYQQEEIIYFNNKINVILTKGDQGISFRLFFKIMFTQLGVDWSNGPHIKKRSLLVMQMK